MTRSPRRAPARPPLPPDSLGYALLQASRLVAEVLDGGNLTDAFEMMRDAHTTTWSDATRGAVRDLAWTTLRDYGRGDAVLRHLLRTPPPALIHALLLVALLRLEQRPEQAYVTVDQAVEAAASVMPGFRGMVNGVLRNALRQPDALAAWRDADEQARYRHPAWWIAKVRSAHPEQWETVLAAGNSHPPMSLRLNARRDAAEAEARLRDAGLNTRRLRNGALLLEQPVAVARLPGHAAGDLSVQDAGAQWATLLLDPQPGERVLDACAAPGGKSAHLLERADIELLALDIDPRRAARVRANLDRLGLDAGIRVADCRDLSAWWDGRPFDRILADVPCSASGVARRHPDIKWLRRSEDIAAFAAQQREILDALWQTLAPGGTMLYATCSVFDEENRLQTGQFLTRHSDAERAPVDGCPEFQLLPDSAHDGFYYALLRKRK